MKHTDSSLHSVSQPGWKLLGEIELTVNADADHTVGKWLAVILSPLTLPVDFAGRVMKSAEEAAARAMQSEVVLKYQHTHLLVFASADRTANGQTWGYFRIEKIDSTEDAGFPNHAIEFYLYLEAL